MEAFGAFGQSYRALYTSILAFSSSGLAGLLLIVNQKYDVISRVPKLYHIGIVSFAFCITITVASNAIGLVYEKDEGISSLSLQQREINKKRFQIIVIALLPFTLGMMAFFTAAYLIV